MGYTINEGDDIMLQDLIDNSAYNSTVVIEGTFKDAVDKVFASGKTFNGLIKNFFKRKTNKKGPAAIAEDVKFLLGNKYGEPIFHAPDGWKSEDLTSDEIEFCKEGVAGTIGNIMDSDPVTASALKHANIGRVHISDDGADISFITIATDQEIYGVWAIYYKGPIGAGRTYCIKPIYVGGKWMPTQSPLCPMYATYDIRQYRRG